MSSVAGAGAGGEGEVGPAASAVYTGVGGVTGPVEVMEGNWVKELDGGSGEAAMDAAEVSEGMPVNP